MKKRVNWIKNQGENCYKILQDCLETRTHFGEKRNYLDPITFGTKLDRDKLIFSAERWGQ